MGALPKRKSAKARQGKRRSHLGLTPPALDYCPQCHSPKLSHRVCPNCGSYASKSVVSKESQSNKSS